MKLFNSDIIKEIDRATCEAQKIDSVELMERAATAISCEIISRFITSQRIVVIAGPGNNGGDALAVARMLIDQGYKRVEIFLFNIHGRLSHDCAEQRRRLMTMDNVDFTEVRQDFNPPYLCPTDVVVDGLFGAGLNEPLQGGFKMLARYVNDSGAYTISIDVPSGLMGEWNGVNLRRDMFHAHLTLAISSPRIAFFFRENAEVIGEWKLLDIDLDRKAIREHPSNYFYVGRHTIRGELRPRHAFASKRDFGAAMIIAGSMGMMGAAVLCARGCLRSGAGLVTVHSAYCGLNVLQAAVPCAMFQPDKHQKVISDMRLKHAFQAVAVGPGIGTHPETIDALEGLLQNAGIPLVLDADALNCIALRPQLLTKIPPLSILTPHAGEFDRLFGEHDSDESRLRKAIEMSRYYNIIIVLKGHYTATVLPDGRVLFNSTGNPGMATGGAGDVMTGVIASFIAQGYKPELAAVMGVYLHGAAGDLAAERLGQWGMTAADIVDALPEAIKKTATK